MARNNFNSFMVGYSDEELATCQNIKLSLTGQYLQQANVIKKITESMD